MLQPVINTPDFSGMEVYKDMNFVKKHYKKILPVFLAVILIASICIAGSVTPSANGTGAGLAEWSLKAYNEGWKYVYGGASAGSVDCSGLIYSYCGGERTATNQLGTATQSGNIGDGIPKIHGLGLYQPGHVGVYIGNGMAVDARDEESGVCCQPTTAKSWTKWFKFSAISYPDNGWVKYNGDYYYYENGEYIVNTSRDIDGVNYKFSTMGVSETAPENKEDVINAETKSATVVTEKLTEKADDVSDVKIDGIVQRGDNNEDVKKVQKQLTELKYFDDECTGFYGEVTESAVKEFQEDNSISTTGVVGEITKDKLFSSDAKVNPDYKATEKSEPAAEKATAAKVTTPAVVKQPVAKSVSPKVKKEVKSNVKTANKVIAKTNVISKKALAGAASTKKAANVSVTDEKNANFLLWMAVVLAIAVFVSGTMFILNHRRKKVYSGAHTRGRKKENITVRYW